MSTRPHLPPSRRSSRVALLWALVSSGLSSLASASASALLGLPNAEGADISKASLRLAPIAPLAVIAAFAFLLFFLAWRTYRQSPADLSPARRRLLLMLRLVFLVLLLGIALRPSLALQIERQQQRTLAVLLDNSASMGIADGPDGQTRAEAARAALGGDLIPEIGERAKLARYTFGAELASGAGFDSDARETARETALGDVLSDTLRRHSADDLAAVLLVSDGSSNTGSAAIEAAAALRDRGVKVFALGVGDTESRDVSVRSLGMPSVALAGDAVPLTVRVGGRGMAGERGRLSITLAGAPAAEKGFVFDGTDAQEIDATILPARAGEFEIKATVTGPGGEVLDSNNSITQGLRVLDSAIRVLMVETAPRWEFKYIQAMLLRERRVELDCFLANADPEVTRVPDSPYLTDFPSRRETLFGYDLILFGDVDPRRLPPSAVSDIASYVAEGGGSLAVLAGKRFTPEAYRNTDLVALLPVELAPRKLGVRPAATRPLALTLTDAGRAAPFMRLDPDPNRAEGRWAQLPPIYSLHRAEGPKPAATSYLATADGGAVIAGHRYGAGEVLWIGTDNTWRWRKNVGDLYHARFWGQVVQKLAGRRLAAGSRRTELSSDRPVAREGEPVQIFARLLDKGFSPRTDETVTASLEGDAGTRPVVLRAVPGSPGYYRAELTADAPGRYRIAVPGDPDGGLDLTFRGADREFLETAMDEATLRAIAETTGGAYMTSEQLLELPGLADLEPTTIRVSREAPLWSSPLFLILLLLPLTLEWVLRKFSMLK